MKQNVKDRSDKPEIVSKPTLLSLDLQGHIEFSFHEDGWMQCCMQVTFMGCEKSSELGYYLLSKHFSIKKQPTTRTKQIKIHKNWKFSYKCIHINTLWKENTHKISEKKSYDSSSHHSDSIWLTKTHKFKHKGRIAANLKS